MRCGAMDISDETPGSPAPAAARKGVFGLMLLLTRSHRWLSLGLLATLFAAAVLEGIGFSLVLPLLNEVVGGRGADPLGALGATLDWLATTLPWDDRLASLLALLLVAFFLKTVALIAAAALTRWFVNSLRLDWMSRTLGNHVDAPYASVAALPQGTVIQNIVGETDTAAKGVYLWVEVTARTLQIVLLLSVVFLASWQVTTAMLAGAAVLAALVWRLTGRYAMAAGTARKLYRQKITEIVAESVHMLRPVKLLGLRDVRKKLVAKQLYRYRTVDTKFEVFSTFPERSTEFLAILLGTFILLVFPMWSGVEPEALFPIVALFGVVFLRIASAAGFLFAKRMAILSAVPSLKVVADNLELAPEPGRNGPPVPTLAAPIHFDDVHLQPPGRAPLFCGLSLEIAQRGLTAIVGPSGVGKTTLVDLLVRLREPDRGRIIIDGVEIGAYDVRSIRARIGYITQDAQLFNGTVEFNLRMGRRDATPEQITRALARAQALDFVEAMPEKMATELGRGAVTLSGGQRQRLAIARELVREPDLYIFDEPTSALDVDAEAVVRELINELAQTHPVVVIAHRLETIRDAARIYRLGDGRAEIVSFAALRESSETIS